jgi:hypothetical protein
MSDGWSVRMPNGSISTTFIGRVDQQLSLLQLGRRVNPGAFESAYQKHRGRYARLTIVAIAAEATEPHESYYKFNLDYLAFYNLIRFEETTSSAHEYYNQAYAVLRDATRSHRNAHFNAIDRALQGPEPFRDSETRHVLDEWLERSRRDAYVDLRGDYASCGADRACDVIEVPNRVRTDFLWQRSPFLLYGGGAGRIETAGIDSILPYWMSRFYGAPV